jgi:SAM-dependent methyltransferase
VIDHTIDYDRLGHGYSQERRADPRIKERIDHALGAARTVVNVGAGAGSYEPADRHVIAIEPSATMRAQRPAGLAPAISAGAESLPLDDDSVDAALAVLTLHHWDDQIRGLREMRRVARGIVVVVTFDVERLAHFWFIADYLPEVLDDDRGRFPAIDEIARELGADATVEEIPIPEDCVDGFFEAYFNRPEQYLKAEIRAAQSAWPRLPEGAEERALKALADDLESGAWDRRYGELREQSEYDGGLRLIAPATAPRLG